MIIKLDQIPLVSLKTNHRPSPTGSLAFNGERTKAKGPEIQMQTHTQWTGSGIAIYKNVEMGNYRSMLRVPVASNFRKLQIQPLRSTTGTRFPKVHCWEQYDQGRTILGPLNVSSMHNNPGTAKCIKYPCQSLTLGQEWKICDQDNVITYPANNSSNSSLLHNHTYLYTSYWSRHMNTNFATTTCTHATTCGATHTLQVSVRFYNFVWMVSQIPLSVDMGSRSITHLHTI